MLDRPKVCHAGPKPGPNDPDPPPFEAFLITQPGFYEVGSVVRWGAYGCYHPTTTVILLNTVWFADGGNFANNDQLINCVQGSDIDWDSPLGPGTFYPSFTLNYSDGHSFTVQGVVTMPFGQP